MSPADVLRWLSALAEPILDLIGAVKAKDAEAERQALLNISRAAHDERARREIAGP